ncbi:MAG: hypothetical protein E7537_04370 [Ruminococcaceae bacterium]|nr:hypothetical protein [Oscillospiraceae bacterium]
MSFFEWFYKIIIVQGICILIILLSVISVKYFFKSEYKKAQDFHKTEIMSDTDIKEVLSSEI